MINSEGRQANVLVTGGGGMVAYFLINLLKDLGASVTSADLPESQLHTDVIGDLRSRGFCKEICENKDIIFNLAGLKGSPQRVIESPATFSVPQVQFGANMAEAAFNSKCEWYLYTSSVGVYHPAEVFYEDDVWKTFPSKHDWYPGWAKRMGELNVQAYMEEDNNPSCSIVRPANIYGPYDNFGEWSMVVPSLIKKAFENDVLEVWGDGSPIRDLIYAEDVARGMLHMVQNKVNEPVNLASGTGVTIKEVAEIVADVFGKEIVWDTSKPMGDMKRIMSTERAESFGFKPQVSLEEGIHKTIEWYLQTKVGDKDKKIFDVKSDTLSNKYVDLEQLNGMLLNTATGKAINVFDFYRYYPHFQFGNKKLIFTYHECSDAQRLDDLLKVMKSDFDMDENDFIIIDGNHNLKVDFMINWDVYLFQPLGDLKGWEYYKKFLFKAPDFYSKLKTKKFLCMNGSFQPHRAILLNDLYKNNCLEDSYYSNNFSGEEFYNRYKVQIKWDWGEIWQDVELEKDFWISDKKRLDGADDSDEHLSIQTHIKYFEDSYFSVVTETWFNSQVPEDVVKDYPIPPLKITEKTYRGLLFHPFIVLGCPYTLKYLRGLGFKTFPEFFDESYDMIEDVRERYEAVLENIIRLNKKSLEELKEMYDSVYDKILHNQRVFHDWDRDKLVLDLYEKIMEKSK